MPGLAPSDAEREEHLPRDETALRALQLGRDVERIVELFHRGVLVRAAGFGGGAYGFFDRKGELRQFGRSESRRLNGGYYDVKRGVCLVAYEPSTLVHVIFENCGAALPSAPPLAPHPTTAELNSAEVLLSTAADRFDDVAALHVIADRLIELGDLRGQLMQAQLSREIGAPYGERELILGSWIPRGLAEGSVRFERGLLYSGTCNSQVTVRHFGWQTIRALHFPLWNIAEPSPFAAELPRLRELSGINGKDFERLLPRFPKGLEALHCPPTQMHHVLLLLGALREFPALHTVGFERFLGAQPMGALEVVLSTRPASLTSLWLVTSLYEPLDVQRALSGVAGFTVNLFSGSIKPGGNATWLSVTSSAFSLHHRGPPDDRHLEYARRKLGDLPLHRTP